MSPEFIKAYFELEMLIGSAPSEDPPEETIKDIMDTLRQMFPGVESIASEVGCLNAITEMMRSGDVTTTEAQGALIMNALDLMRRNLTRSKGGKPSEFNVQWTMAARIAVDIASDNIQKRVSVFNAAVARFKRSTAPGLTAPGATKRAELFKVAEQYNAEDPAGTSALVEAYRDPDHVLWKA